MKENANNIELESTDREGATQGNKPKSIFFYLFGLISAISILTALATILGYLYS